jgi:glycosyltransferase involved in cell wall biosynthesis
MFNLLVLNVSLKEGMAGTMRVKNLVFPLLSKNVTVTNLALTHTYEKHKINESGKLENGIKYQYIGYKNPFNIIEIFIYFFSGLKFIFQNKSKSKKNIIYNYGYPDIKNLPIILFAKLIGYKIIFDIVEDNRYATSFSGFLGWIRMKSSIFILNTVGLWADLIIVISSQLETRLKQIVKNKISIIHIPITINIKKFNTNNWNPNQNNFKVFYGGSFFLGKDGIEYLIEAFNNISSTYNEIELILSGKSVSEKDMNKIFKLIESNKKIKYLGYLSEEKYFEVLNECDIFCMPRNNSKLAHAGFPFKLGEFLSIGKAIISTNVGDVSKYLTHMKDSYLIEPESVEQIEKGLLFFLNTNENIIIEMGNEARKTALKHFDSINLSNYFFSNLLNL